MSDSCETLRLRWYAERALELLGNEDVAVDVPDELDGLFRARSAGEAVALRVDELAREARSAVFVREPVRAYRRAIGRAAERRWEEQGGPPVQAWIGFGEYEQSTAGRDREEIAGRLCELVRASLPGEGAFAEILPDEHADASFPLGLASVTVARPPTYGSSCWAYKPSGDPPTVDAETLRAAVGRAPDADADTLLRVLVAGEPDVLRVEMEEDAADGLDDGGYDGVHLLRMGPDEIRTLAGG